MRPHLLVLAGLLVLRCQGSLDPPLTDGPPRADVAGPPADRSQGQEPLPGRDAKITVDQKRAPDHPPGTCLTQAEYDASLTADFAQRDALPQTPAPKPWKCLTVCQTQPASGCYDVCKAPVFNAEQATVYAKPKIPTCVDPLQWQRDRVVAAAKKFIGVAYLPCSRLPACGGLDCSDYTSWVYNYGLGIKFSPGAVDQSNLSTATKIDRAGSAVDSFITKLQKGDLIFFRDKGQTDVQHVAIYISGYDFIHSNPTPKNGVQLGTLKPSAYNWYEQTLVFARRVIQ
jgi:cell wall-associated NlpC family hydrolase